MNEKPNASAGNTSGIGRSGFRSFRQNKSYFQSANLNKETLVIIQAPIPQPSACSMVISFSLVSSRYPRKFVPRFRGFRNHYITETEETVEEERINPIVAYL